MFKQLVTMSLCAALGACASFRPLPQHDAAALQAVIEPGDEVVVATRDGKAHRFTVREITATEIAGTRDGRSHRVPLEAVTSVQLREMDVGRTLANTGTAITGAATAALVVGGIALIIAIEEHD